MLPLFTSDHVQDVRDRIRAVAERQFTAQGAAKTSMRTIAQELGWTAASLYRYFHNKDELLAATRTAALDCFSDCIEAACFGERDVWGRSRAVGPTYVGFAFPEKAAYQLIFAFERPMATSFQTSRAPTPVRGGLCDRAPDRGADHPWRAPEP